MPLDNRVELVRWALTASAEEVGPACMNVTVPATIRNDDDFREAYVQGYRHALADAREWLGQRSECVENIAK